MYAGIHSRSLAVVHDDRKIIGTTKAIGELIHWTSLVQLYQKKNNIS